jgi:hypothetical protein
LHVTIAGKPKEDQQSELRLPGFSMMMYRSGFVFSIVSTCAHVNLSMELGDEIDGLFQGDTFESGRVKFREVGVEIGDDR